MGFLRRTAGVAQGTPNWAVLSELNCKPYHFYWVRAVLKFHRSIMGSNSPLLQDVFKADALLARSECVVHGMTKRCESCWSAELARGLKSIADIAGDTESGLVWHDAVRAGTQVDSTSVLQALEVAYAQLAWKGCSDLQDIRVSSLVDGDGLPVGRKFATYFAWFKQQGVPSYLWSPITRHKAVRHMLRFRLGSR